MRFVMFIVRAVGRRASQIPFSKEIGFSNSNARPSVRRSVACRSEPGIQIKAAWGGGAYVRVAIPIRMYARCMRDVRGDIAQI